MKEIAKLIQLSPKRSTLFSKNLADYKGGITLKSLCPTRWTVRTAVFSAVIEDYVVIQETMEEVSDTTHDQSGKEPMG